MALLTTAALAAALAGTVAGEVRIAREADATETRLQVRVGAHRPIDADTGVRTHLDAQLVGSAEATRAGRVNEAWLGADLPDGWAVVVGRRIVAWDVGHGLRPNDVVQREPRRPLLPATPQGRGVLQIERADADTATTLVAIEPLRRPDDPAGGAALALRHFRRAGASLDLHLHADWRRDSRLAAGLALAWIASDALGVHASTRWQPARGVHQSLAGLSWTGGPGLTVTAEAWHDGEARPRATRLATYLRASLDLGAWTPAIDLLHHPRDGGRVIGAGLTWQGDRWRMDAAWRLRTGPAGAWLRQGPDRRHAAIAATLAF